MSKTIRTTTRPGFTLVELMVVVGIIAVLISVLIPVIASVRIRAYDADTKSWVQQLSAAVERYQSDFRAYPGPLADSQINVTPFPLAPFSSFSSSSTPTGVFDTGLTITQITGSENLTLALLGGLTINGTNLIYDPAQVGLGPQNLNLANPKRYQPYVDATPASLSWRSENGLKTGRFADGTGPANDTIIPEFLDHYPSGPMPILYLRARRGVANILSTDPGYGPTKNSVMTDNGNNPRVGTYDLSQIIGYTSSNIGEGKRISSGDYVNVGSFTFPSHGLRWADPTMAMTNPPPTGRSYRYPYDAFAYFESPQMPNTARNKDSFILISAGPDRVYGTRDDIVSFGAVGE